ncbi:MAG: hypothetical protein PHC54_02505 [Candidatus Omnitrophica bacterium]|nr:hypothetical protein [Candidatus Omnitrophota bacterium]MDD5592255.1 hypothetical protein [Candidatus Omnitrophota bacterium]
MNILEQIMIGFIGRPILTLIKWLRWYFFLGGIMFNTVEIYDPATKSIVSSQFTIIPFLLGLVLLAIGLTVKRYDENVATLHGISMLEGLQGKIRKAYQNGKEADAQERVDKDYQETLQLLAEGRQVLNKARSERLRDDSSPFNPRLSENEASGVIKKSVEAIEQEEKQNKSKQDNKK